MEGYRTFTRREVRLWTAATQLVADLPDFPGQIIRCHELARAMGVLLNLEVVDGHYGLVEHTWINTHVKNDGTLLKGARPRILDVYLPGALPMVHLVDGDALNLPTGKCYKPGKSREDIDKDMVAALFGTLRSLLPSIRSGL